jgi:hypothetical protein
LAIEGMDECGGNDADEYCVAHFELADGQKRGGISSPAADHVCQRGSPR